MIQNGPGDIDVIKEKISRLAMFAEIVDCKYRCFRQSLLLQLDEVRQGDCASHNELFCQFCTTGPRFDEIDVSHETRAVLSFLESTSRVQENHLTSVLIGTFHKYANLKEIYGLLGHWPYDMVTFFCKELRIKELIMTWYEHVGDVPTKFFILTPLGKTYLQVEGPITMLVPKTLSLLVTTPNQSINGNLISPWRPDVNRRHDYWKRRFYPKTEKPRPNISANNC